MRSLLSSSAPDPAPAGDDAVQQARTRARRRLVGALVLLVAGVVGFPMLFETQPRPLPVDTPIVTPTREVNLPPRAASASHAGLSAESAADKPVAAAAPASAASVAAVAASLPAPASSASAAKGAVTATDTAAATTVPVPAPASVPAGRAAERAPQKAAAKAAERSPVAAHASAAASAAGRFVVQAGAYTDAATLRDARARVERLGLKTYTQVIEGDNGKRTRVRVGPFVSREEAQSVAGKLKAAGLPANILAL